MLDECNVENGRQRDPAVPGSREMKLQEQVPVLARLKLALNRAVSNEGIFGGELRKLLISA